MNLLKEAQKISEDLDDVVFIGAIAVQAHTGRGRQTHDIDLALSTPMSDEELENRGYYARVENGKKVRRSPRGVRVDIYTEDVSGIEVSLISKTAETKSLGKGETIRIMCLEALLLAKLRASRPSRPQDAQDIQELISYRKLHIDWTVFEELGANEIEFANLKKLSSFRR
ncbi:MAG TPA: nucleotidyltransferase [Nitrososphaerales archaeon]|nr:nucleotidyltransferase [Nitrososphaerales archaeon]